MEIIGICILSICLWYAQSKPEKKTEEKKKPDITVEIVFNRDHRNKRLDS